MFPFYQITYTLQVHIQKVYQGLLSHKTDKRKSVETKGERSRGYITLGSSVNKACFRATYVVQEYHIAGVSDDVERLYFCV